MTCVEEIHRRSINGIYTHTRNGLQEACEGGVLEFLEWDEASHHCVVFTCGTDDMIEAFRWVKGTRKGNIDQVGPSLFQSFATPLVSQYQPNLRFPGLYPLQSVYSFENPNNLL